MSTGVIIALSGFALFVVLVVLVERYGKDLDLSDPEKLKDKYRETDAGAGFGGPD